MRVKFFGLFFAVAGFCALLVQPPARAQTVGEQVTQALAGQTLDGKAFDLADYRGKKAVIIHFWATWCAPCHEEMPALEAVWRQYKNRDLAVLAISIDRASARGAVDQVMHYFSYPAAMYSALSKNEFGTPSSLPLTYVIDKEGVVQAVLTPPASLNEATLGALVKGILDAKPEPKPDVKADARADDKK